MSSLSIISSDDQNRRRTVQSKFTSLYLMGFWTGHASSSNEQRRSQTKTDLHI